MAKSVLLLAVIQALIAVRVAANYVPRQVSTPSLNFSFDDESQWPAFTCQGLDVHWLYAGPQGTINLYATNAGVPQMTPPLDPLPTSTVDLTIVTVTLATNIDAAAFSFNWSSVNVPQGWYILNASMPAQLYSVRSPPFYVRTGNDISCLSNSLTPTSNGPKSTTANPSPVAAASHSGTIPVAVIIGASLGLAIVVSAFIVAYIWFKRGRQRKRRAKGEYPNATHHWKELGSSDSRGALRGDQPSPNHQSPRRSVFHSGQSDEGAGGDKGSINSKLESTALSCEQEVALAALPVLTHQSSRSRTFAINRPHSSSSLATSGPSTYGHSPTPERRPSVRDTISSLDSVSYPPARPTLSSSQNTNRDQRASMLDDSRSSLQPGSQISIEAIKQANRQSLGRKRKPVPVYDGEEPSSPSVPPPLPTSPVSPTSSPLETFFSASPASSTIGHYVTRNHSVQESGHPDLALNGNNGPGDRPVHYLIPDMPVSQH